MSSIEIDAFPKDNQPWRIEWIGQIFYMTDDEFLIRIHISRLKADASKDKPLHNTSLAGHEERIYDRRHFDIKVGFIQFLTIGSVWVNGFRQLDYRADEEIFEIDNPSTLQLTSLDQEGCDRNKNHVLHNYQYRVENSARSDSAVLMIYGHPSYKQIVIPSTVVYQSCYVTSPKAASAILYGKLDKLISIAKSGFVDGLKKTFRVVLRQNFTDEEQVLLANLGADNTARRNLIALQQKFAIAGNSVPAQPYSIELGFPFSGLTKLQVFGKRIGYPGKTKNKDEYGFLVSEIVRIDTEFPFVDLQFDRDNNNDTADKLPENLQSYDRTAQPNKKPDERESTKFTNNVPTKRSEDTKLPILSIVTTSHIKVIDIQKDEQHYARMPFKGLPCDEAIIDGVSTGNKKNVTEGASQLNTAPVPVDFDAIFEIIKHLRNYNLDVQELDVLDARRSSKGIVNFFPYYFVPRHRWHRREDKSSGRAFVIVQLYQAGQFYYLIDIEAKNGYGLSIALVTRWDRREITINDFERILKDVVRENGWQAFATAHAKKNYVLQKVNHNHSDFALVANNILKKFGIVE